MARLSVLVLAVVAVAACHKQTAVKAPTPVAAAPAPAPAAQPAPAPQPASPNLAVAGDLAQQCKVAVNSTDKAPKFDFNEFELLPQDRDVLDQIATCLTSGPLKGKHLKLVGRADSRGTEEYNLGLGTQRAGTVRDYLVRLGVTNTQLAESTRGALDAKGHDEDSWRTDRRVDVDLVR